MSSVACALAAVAVRVAKSAAATTVGSARMEIPLRRL
jgi:hypothetical protein